MRNEINHRFARLEYRVGKLEERQASLEREFARLWEAHHKLGEAIKIHDGVRQEHEQKIQDIQALINTRVGPSVN